MKRNLADPKTWREACRLMVVYATENQLTVRSFMDAREFLKREWNVTAIQANMALNRHLADVFYSARLGVLQNQKPT